MPSIPLIVDEWVIHDLRGDNLEGRQMETFQFLTRVEAKCDHLVLLHRSPWMRKAYKLMKEVNPRLRLFSRFLRNTFLLNSSKCKIVGTNEIAPLPPELRSVVPSDDLYLIELHTVVPKSTIVTTDVKLVEALSNLPNVTVRLRDEFLKNYM